MAEITIEVIQPTPVNITIETAPGAAGTSVAWDNVTSKPATFAPSAHTHAASAISDSTAAGRTLLTAVDSAAQRTALALGNVDNTSDVNKPVSSATQTALNGKANTTHGHIIGDVTGLQTALDGKAALIHTHAIGDLSGVSITSPANDEVLAFESSSGLWKNKTASSGGITNGQSITNALIFG